MAMGVHRSGRPGRASRRAPMAEINVTPLVDVMLVLLIVFMVTAPLLTAGVPVQLPDSRANALPQEAQEVTVTLANDGFVYVDSDAMGPDELPSRLAVIASRESGALPNVTLRADRGLPYGEVMGVMGELNRAGFNSISLVTNTAAGPPQATIPAAAPDVAPEPAIPSEITAADDTVTGGSEVQP